MLPKNRNQMRNKKTPKDGDLSNSRENFNVSTIGVEREKEQKKVEEVNVDFSGEEVYEEKSEDETRKDKEINGEEQPQMDEEMNK